MTQATPRPWRRVGNLIKQDLDDRLGPIVARVAGPDGPLDAESVSNADLIVRAVNRDHLFDELVGALEAAERIVKNALPKFNWGASNLDAEAIQALNEGCLKIERARAALEKAKAQ